MLYREYENMSFYGMLERTAQKYGEKPAISFNEDGHARKPRPTRSCFTMSAFWANILKKTV